MSATSRLQSRDRLRFAALGSALLALLLGLLAIANTAAPAVDIAYGATKIKLAADRAWTFFPGDCVEIEWELEGIKSVYIDGRGQIGQGSQTFCPAINASDPIIEVTGAAGIYRRLELNLHHLPDLLLYLAGFIGIFGTASLMLVFLWRHQIDRQLRFHWLAIGGCLLTLVAGVIRLSPQETPLIDVDEGAVAVRFWAERDSIVFPHECIAVGWSVTGAAAIHYQGREVAIDRNPGAGQFCAGAGDAATLAISASDGARREYSLPIASLFPEPYQTPAPVVWSLFWLIAACAVFGILAGRGVGRNWREVSRSDAAATAACLLFPLALYLPFGFESAAHWENWILHSYIEGGPPGFFDSWIVSRHSGLVHRVLAYLISSESFVGYNLVNSLMQSATTALCYGILRQLKVPCLYAFLMAVLFIVYPVNPMQLSLRSLLLNFSKLTFLAAVYLVLEFRRAPTRLKLCGLWLALSFSVNSYESGLALVLAAPLLWCLTKREHGRRNLNLTAIWYLVPAFKVAYVLLLATTGREFYQSGFSEVAPDSLAAASSFFASALEVVRWAYRYTFIDGWREALLTLERGTWWLPTLVTLAAIAGIAAFLFREQTAIQLPTRRQLAFFVAAGLLLLLPAIGLLMWLPLYRFDPWRMLLYAPVGAVIALFCALLFFTRGIHQGRLRDIIVTGVCLLLLAPATASMFSQLDHFVESANRKSHILRQILELAPAPAPGIDIALITEMDSPTMRQIGVNELLNRDMFYSALRVLYQDRAPSSAYFCRRINECSQAISGETVFSAAAPGELLGRTLVFRLGDDLAVDLVEDPASLLGLELRTAYDASLLYDAGAPLPARAETMLRPAKR